MIHAERKKKKEEKLPKGRSEKSKKEHVKYKEVKFIIFNNINRVEVLEYSSCLTIVACVAHFLLLRL